MVLTLSENDRSVFYRTRTLGENDNVRGISTSECALGQSSLLPLSLWLSSCLLKLSTIIEEPLRDLLSIIFQACNNLFQLLTTHIDSCVICINANLSFLHQKKGSFRNKLNKRGPKTESCGTPFTDSCQGLTFPLTLTCCFLFER